MARPYRLQGENYLYHIMSRGDDRKKIFTSPGDYSKFLDYTLKGKEKYQFYLYAYCLMVNHYHLLIETRLPNISKVMHYINGSYTIYYNIRHRRCGHLFQGRFKSIVVDKDNYFLELSRYIHLNPVLKGIVKDPREYRWSSYQGYIGGTDKYIDRDQVQRYLDMGRRQYRRFVLDGIGKIEDPLSKVYAGFILRSVRFTKDTLKNLKVQIVGEEVAYRQVLHDNRVKPEEIIRAVNAHYHTTLDQLRTGKTRPRRAKKVLIYLLREYTGLTNREIGAIVEMRYSAVSKAGLAIERLAEQDKDLKRKIKSIVSNFEV